MNSNFLTPELTLPHHKSYLLAILLLTIPLTSIIQPLSLVFWPHLCGIIAVLIFMTSGTSLKNLWSSTLTRLTFFLGAICLLTSLSLVWSVTDENTSRNLKIVAGLMCTIPLAITLHNLPTATQQLFRKYFSIPLIAGGAYIATELLFNFPLWTMLRTAPTEGFSNWQMNKHVSVFILLCPFAIHYTWQDKRWINTVILGIITIAVLLATASQAAQLAAVAMLIAATGLKCLPRLALPVCFASCAAVIVALPWVSPYLYDAFADKVGDEGIIREACTSQRLEIWDFIARKITENPWTGFGIDSTRYMTFEGRNIYYLEPIVMHPHSLSMQIWIEFGMIGVATALIILAAIYSALNKLSYNNRYLPVIALSGGMVFLLFSWSIWSGWLLGLIMLLVVMSLQKIITTQNGSQST